MPPHHRHHHHQNNTTTTTTNNNNNNNHFQASPEEVADLTIGTLLRTVPPAMPGVFFLSGDTRIDEDNEETASRNLNNMNRRHKVCL